MLILKWQKFAVKHPLLTHGARQHCEKGRAQKTTSPKGGIPYETESSRSRIPSWWGLILGIIGATVSITSIEANAANDIGPASGTPVQAL